MTARQERLYSDVAFLAGIRPFRNYRNTESLNRAADHISHEFRLAGFEPEEQKWIARGREYKNIIASYNPNKLWKLIAGAHYDAAGNQPGADDNASGVAGLLETARLVAENKPDMDYGIDFVAYCLEEPPFFGSKEMGSFVHAESLFRRMTPVAGMVCFEMIGCFSDADKSQRFPSDDLRRVFPGRGNFILVVGIDRYRNFNERFHRLMSADAKIDVRILTLPEGNGYAGLSDQRNYWKFGYRALMINDTSDFRNRNYHRKTDTIDTLDFERMAHVVSSAYQAISGMVIQ